MTQQKTKNKVCSRSQCTIMTYLYVPEVYPGLLQNEYTLHACTQVFKNRNREKPCRWAARGHCTRCWTLNNNNNNHQSYGKYKRKVSLTHVCIRHMYSMHAFYVYILCAYSMRAFYARVPRINCTYSIMNHASNLQTLYPFWRTKHYERTKPQLQKRLICGWL